MEQLTLVASLAVNIIILGIILGSLFQDAVRFCKPLTYGMIVLALGVVYDSTSTLSYGSGFSVLTNLGILMVLLVVTRRPKRLCNK